MPSDEPIPYPGLHYLLHSFPAALGVLLGRLDEYPLPPWSSIVVIEPDGAGSEFPIPAMTFDARFQEILTLCTDWVNVHVIDVRDNVLRVTVAYRPAKDGEMISRENTTVMLGGPNHGAWLSMGIDPETHPSFESRRLR